MKRGLALGGLLVVAIGAALWALLLRDPGTAPPELLSETERSLSGPETQSAPEPDRQAGDPEAEGATETAVGTTPRSQPQTQASPTERDAGAEGAARRPAEVQLQELESAETDRAGGGPSFDVVRVERDGSSVMAGRAAPNSDVVVTRNGEEVARGRADSRGEFVILPERALPPGDYALELEATTAGGAAQAGRNVVVLSVPEAASTVAEAGQASDAGSLVVQLPVDTAGAARVMQLPEPAPAEVAGGLWLEAIDYDAAGRLVISGQGLPGDGIVVYLDNTALSEARIDSDGRWRVTPSQPVAPGLYTLRIDQLNGEGAVTARVESPFARAAFETANLPADERFVVIQPGNNLWTIASRTYGEGPRYTVIFDANADQIRDPDLIYPGQIFVLPSPDSSG
ncbi:LysM peptidoglycan-binding domain-containing protein [Algihabitans albus]|uniref:LysM peptidoglycan-binding domain-containing protein n=1 Tax=Algihabitans albus TaxID=2164067 RepID=UPI000E5D5925|nr:LysM peptidoglycan-binding domain-containing protein [Algihabitans albus]